VIKDLRSSDPVSVGPYRLVGRLGAGGMGQVYLARSPGGRQVAIKVIKPELAEEREFRVRFAREVAAARNVSGMFTAAVVDADPDGPEPWMATAYVAGPSLLETEPLPEQSVLTLAAGLAEGLGAIHRAGLVHRDLKPSNVLLASDGPRVIDFGISHALEGSMLTQTKTVMGTAGYMSPEQARGLVVGPASDVFSLGAVLTFAATGEGPFGVGPVHAMIYRVVHEPPDLTRVPDGLRPVIEWCMAKAPGDRPTTGQLLGELAPRVNEITGSWLPEQVSVTLGRYVRTTPNRVTPAAPAADQPETEDIPSARAAGAAPAADVAGDAEDVAGDAAVDPVAAEAARAEPAPSAVPAAEPEAELVTGDIAREPSGAQTVGAAVDDAADTDVGGALIPGLALAPEAEHDDSAAEAGAAEPEAAEPEAAEPEAAVPGAAGQDPGDPAGRGPAGPSEGSRRRRWPLAAVAAAVAIAAALTLALELSSAGSAKVIGGPTSSVTVAGSRSATAKPTDTASAVAAKKPAKKPKPPAKHVVKRHRSSPASSTTPTVTQTAPAQASTTPAANPTTPAANPTTPAPTRTTPVQSGPQTISSASGVSPISCDQFGNVGSSAGGSGVSFSFVNESAADEQVWYLNSSDAPVPEDTVSPGATFSPGVATGQDWAVGNSASGCMAIYAITGSGQVTVS
jgi:eukaryotic-like serine/threonine-protein kinase